MGITSNKDINELCRKAMRLGWRVFQTGRNHLRWVPPDDIVQKYGKAFVTTSLTPSDTNAINQIERDLKKAGLWHLEETMEKVDRDQTPEEKYLNLGTSLPIPLNPDKPTFADVFSPELKPKPAVEEQGMPKSEPVRHDRSELRSTILQMLKEADGPLSTQEIFDKIPGRLKNGGFEKSHVPGMINTINRALPGSIMAPQRGLYMKGAKADIVPAQKLNGHAAPPATDLDVAGIIERALTSIAELEKLVAYVKEREAAMAAVRKLLGGV